MVKDAVNRGHRKIIYHAATGSGKGLVMSHVVSSYVRMRQTVLTVMRRRDVVFQTMENYKKYHGMYSMAIMGRETGGTFVPSVVASIDTLYRRYQKIVLRPKVVIIDECHDASSDKYKEVMDYYDDGKTLFLGFSATPFLINGKGHDWWDVAVEPIKPHELRNQGYLVDCKIKIPDRKIDTTGIKVVGGDYNQKALARAASDAAIVGDIVENYNLYCKGQIGILFAVSISHSKMLAERFNASGIPAMHCDQSSSKDERARAISMLKSRKINVLCNVNIFSTGVDIPELQFAIIARPTKSEVLWVQQIGRVLRTHEGKDHALILDFTHNTETFGGPYDVERPAVLKTPERRPKKDEDVECEKKDIICVHCLYSNPRGSSVCEGCGESLVRSLEEAKGRLKDYVEKRDKDGNIVEVHEPTSARAEFSYTRSSRRECIKVTYEMRNMKESLILKKYRWGKGYISETLVLDIGDAFESKAAHRMRNVFGSTIDDIKVLGKIERKAEGLSVQIKKGHGDQYYRVSRVVVN